MLQQNHWITAAAALLVWTTPLLSGAAETDVDDARNSVVRGRTHYNQGEYREALAEFQRAWNLIKLPSTALSVARANEKLGQLAAAARMYREAAVLVPSSNWPKEPQKVQAQQQAQADAQLELEALVPRIPALYLKVAGIETSEFALTIDGIPLAAADLSKPLELDPGEHTIVVKANDGRQSNQVVVLAEGKAENVTIDLAGTQLAPPSSTVEDRTRPVSMGPPPREQRALQEPTSTRTMHTRSSMPTVTWIGIGIGSAALAFGTTSGIVAYARLKKADCGSDNKCSHEVYGQQGASYNAWRKASTIGFMVGGVSAAFVGITWLAVNPKQNGGEQIGVTVGPSGLAMEGTF